jgi:hypothetical protein
MLLFLVLQRFAAGSRKRQAALVMLLAGSLVTFIGGMLFVFVSSAVFGVSFYVSTLGLAIILGGVIVSMAALLKSPYTSSIGQVVHDAALSKSG